MRPDETNQNTQEPPLNNTPPLANQPGYIIQPLSSEDELRATTANPASIAPSDTPSQPFISDSSSPIDQLSSRQNPPTQQTPITQTESFNAALPPILDSSESSKKKSGLKTLSVIVLLLTVLGAGTYFLFFHNKPYDELPAINIPAIVTDTALKDEDLILETYQATSYLRPDEWAKQDGGMSSYGSPKKQQDKPIAAILVTEDNPQTPIVNASQSTYNQMRDQTIQTINDTIEIRKKQEGSTASCTSPITSLVEPDTTTASAIIGLATLVINCERSDGEYKLKSRFTVGTDGRTRIITVAATGDEWDRNGAIFEKMLASVNGK